MLKGTLPLRYPNITALKTYADFSFVPQAPHLPLQCPFPAHNPWYISKDLDTDSDIAL